MKKLILLLMITLNISANFVHEFTDARSGLSAVVISDVRSSNPTSAAMTVSWITDSVTSVNEVHYGKTTALGFTAVDSRVDDTHWVDITDLSAQTAYYYEVVSDDVVDDNGGAYYTFTTARVGYGPVYAIYGRVFKEDLTPAYGAIIYAEVVREGVTSAPISTLIRSDGRWALDLGNLKDSIGGVFPYSVGNAINIFVQGAADGTGTASTTVSGSMPQDCGDIIITSGDIPTVPVSGRVRLAGRTEFNAYFTFEVRIPGRATPIETHNVMTDIDGNFTIEVSVPEGDYNITVKEWHYLRGIASNVHIAPPSVTDVFFTPEELRGGDCNGDNNVNIADFSILAFFYGQTYTPPTIPPLPPYPPPQHWHADINGDGEVNPADFSILAASYGRKGVF